MTHMLIFKPPFLDDSVFQLSLFLVNQVSTYDQGFIILIEAYTPEVTNEIYLLN